MKNKTVFVIYLLFSAFLHVNATEITINKINNRLLSFNVGQADGFRSNQYAALLVKEGAKFQKIGLIKCLGATATQSSWVITKKSFLQIEDLKKHYILKLPNFNKPVEVQKEIVSDYSKMRALEHFEESLFSIRKIQEAKKLRNIKNRSWKSKQLQFDRWKKEELNEVDKIFEEVSIDQEVKKHGRITQFDLDKNYNKILKKKKVNPLEIKNKELLLKKGNNWILNKKDQKQDFVSTFYSAKEIGHFVNTQIKILNEFELLKIEDPKNIIFYNSNSKLDTLVSIDEKNNDQVNEITANNDERWSSNMNDRELRNFLIKNGAKEEALRRKNVVLNERVDNEIFIRGGLAFSDNTSGDESNGEAGFGNDVHLGYNYSLKSWSEKLSKLSIEFGVNWSKSYYDMGASSSINLIGSGTQYGLGMRYYIYNDPKSIRLHTFYLGLMTKIGKIDFEGNTFSDGASYSYSSFPELSVGHVYRFPKKEKSGRNSFGFGLLGLISLEKANFSESTSNSTELLSEASFTNLKIAYGINVYF